MTLNYQLCVDNYVEAYEEMAMARPINYYGIKILGAIALIIPVVGYVLGLMSDAVGAVWAAGSLSSGVYVLFFSRWTIRWTMKLWFRAAFRKNPEARADITLTCSIAELDFRTSNAATQLKWNAYKKYSETRNLFMLCLHSNLYQIVPKRAFATEAEREQFKAWASTIGQKVTGPPIPSPMQSSS